MAQAGFTPIQLYYSTTASAVPTAGNLASGELAINISDGKLYYKNASNVVTLLATAGSVSSQWVTSGSDIYYNTGNVGVGTSTPNYKLQVTSAGSASEIVASNTAGGERIHLLSRNAAGVSYIQAQNAQLLVGTYDNYVMQFMTNNTTKMLLDTSGNLGLGVTPSAWGTQPAIQQLGGALWGVNAANYEILQNAFYNGTNYIYRNTNLASRYNQNAGVHAWFTAPSGTAGNAITFTQAMTLTAGGSLGVGTTSPQNLLHLVSSAPAIRLEDTSGDAYALIDCDSPDEGTIRISADPGNTGANSIIAFRTDGTERVRISAVGGFSVGTTSDPGAGAIYATGNITAYFSDNRLKTRLGGIENALDKVEKLSGFYYEANETAQALGYKPKREVGVSAQEVQAVLPEVVSPAPVDQQYLTVDYERLVPLLIEAIKELRAEVRALKGV